MNPDNKKRIKKLRSEARKFKHLAFEVEAEHDDRHREDIRGDKFRNRRKFGRDD